MTNRQEEQVFILAIHFKIGVVVHAVEEQGGKIVRTTQRRTGVTALNRVYHA
jgi:hypothetical protein